MPAPPGFATGALQNPGAGWHPGCWPTPPHIRARWILVSSTQNKGRALPLPPGAISDGGCPLRVAVHQAWRRSKRISGHSAVPIPASFPRYGAGSEPSSCLLAFMASQWEKSISKVIKKELERPRATRRGACRSGVAKPRSIPREKPPQGCTRVGLGPPVGAVRGLTLAEKARRASALSLPLLFLAGGKTPGTGGSAGGSAERGARLGPVPLPGESKPQGCRGRLSGLCACCCDRAGLGNGLGRKQIRHQGRLPLPRSSEAARLGGGKAALLPCPPQHPQPNPPGDGKRWISAVFQHDRKS